MNHRHLKAFTLACTLMATLVGQAVSAAENSELQSKFNQAAAQTTQLAAQWLESRGYPPRHQEAVAIRIYTEQSKLLQDAPTNVAKNASSTGFYNPDTKQMGVLFSGSTDETLHFIRHEAMHHELYRHTSTAPAAWLDEGTAEMFSRNPDCLLSNHAPQLEKVYKVALQIAVQKQNALKLEALFNLQHENFYSRDQDLNYATAYAFTVFVYETYGSQTLATLLGQGDNAGRWVMDNLSRGNPKAFEDSFYAWAIR